MKLHRSLLLLIILVITIPTLRANEKIVLSFDNESMPAQFAVDEILEALFDKGQQVRIQSLASFKSTGEEELEKYLESQVNP
ncbi:MAG: hypothetical protein ACP5E3_08810, partial [Bacteroidales bacterium]